MMPNSIALYYFGASSTRRKSVEPGSEDPGSIITSKSTAKAYCCRSSTKPVRLAVLPLK
jgi:hypothetical protein